MSMSKLLGTMLLSMSFQFHIANSIAHRCKHAAEQIYIGKTKLEIKRHHKEIKKLLVFAFANYQFYDLVSCFLVFDFVAAAKL